MVLVYHAADLPTGDAMLNALAAVRSMLWCGVDLFFVLSGFLITRILLATRDRPNYFRSFYARRTLRIFPLYFGVLIVLFVFLPIAAALLGGPLASLTASTDYQTLADRQLWLWTYTQNFLQARGPSQLPGFGHFWSLAVEEQFYLAWPMVALTLGARRLGWLCLAIGIGTPIVRGALLAVGAEPWAVFHWTFTRFDTLALGALAAVIARDDERLANLRRYFPTTLLLLASGWLLCGLFAANWRGFEWSFLRAPIQTAGYSIIALLFAATLLCVLTRPNAVPIIHWRCLRILGKYSYAMYVFHWPLCRIAEETLPQLGLLTTGPAVQILLAGAARVAFVLTSSFLLAWASWHAWEKHWLKLKAKFTYQAA